MLNFLKGPQRLICEAWEQPNQRENCIFVRIVFYIVRLLPDVRFLKHVRPKNRLILILYKRSKLTFCTSKSLIFELETKGKKLYCPEICLFIEKFTILTKSRSTLLTHEYIKLLEYQLDWVKIVDFKFVKQIWAI